MFDLATISRPNAHQFLREELAEMLAESGLPTLDEADAALRCIADVQAVADSLVRSQDANAARFHHHAQQLTQAAAVLRRFVERT